MTKSKRIITVLLIICLLIFAMIYYGMYFFGLSGMHSKINNNEDKIKVACIGDSTTYGHGIKNWKNNSYPSLLQKELGDDYYVVNFGLNGACVQSYAQQPYADNEIFKESVLFDADIIIFMFGTNDSSAYNFRSKGDFKKEYSELMRSFLEIENNPEIILCTPPSAFYRNGKTDGTAEYDVEPDNLKIISEAVNELANEMNYNLVDCFSATSQHPDWFGKDGIHPNSEGASELAKLISDSIE